MCISSCSVCLCCSSEVFGIFKSQTEFSGQCDALLMSNMATNVELPAFKRVDCLISRHVSDALLNTSLSVCSSLTSCVLFEDSAIYDETVPQQSFLPVCCHDSLRVGVNLQKGALSETFNAVTCK